MGKRNQWSIVVTVGKRTWTWQKDTREEASALASRIATHGCSIAVGKLGGFDRIAPGMIHRIRVTPPRNIIATTANHAGVMTIASE